MELMEGLNKSKNAPKIKNQQQRITISKEQLKRQHRTVAIASALITTVLATGTNTLNERANKFEDRTDYILGYKYIVTENTHRTEDNKNYYYDTDDIAFVLSELDDTVDKDAVIYATYINMDARMLVNMDEVMESLSRYEEEESKYKQYNSFQSYVKGLNFIDKSGNADIEGYKKYMDEYVCHLSRLENVKENGGKTK